METIYNNTNIPFYIGDTVPESNYDDRYASSEIPNGIFYIDTLNHNVYVMTDNKWEVAGLASLASSDSVTSKTSVITSDLINVFGEFKTFRVDKSTYYTSTYNNLTSIILPQTSRNRGSWFAIVDSLSQGYNICVDGSKGLKVIEYVGGISGVSSKHYFFCDGKKWHLAKSFGADGTNIDIAGASYTIADGETVLVEVSNTLLNDYDNAESINWNDRNLYDVEENTSLNWNERTMYNINGDEALNWTESVRISNINYSQEGLRQGTVYADLATGNLKIAILKANLTGTATINSGDSATLTVTFTCGVAPWSIDYSDGINSTTINDIMDSPYEFEVSPTVSKTFTLVAVNDQFDSGVPSGNPRITVTVIP